MADNNNLNIIVKVVDQATKKLQEIDKLVKKLGTTSADTAEKAKKLTPKNFKKWDRASLQRSVIEQDKIVKDSADKRIKYAQHNRESEQRHQRKLDADRLRNIQQITAKEAAHERKVIAIRRSLNNQQIREYNANERKKEAEAKRISNAIDGFNNKSWKEEYKQLAKEKAAQITQAERDAKEKKRVEGLNKLKNKIIANETLKLNALDKTKIKFIKNQEGLERFVAKRRQSLEQEKELGQLKQKYLADQTLKLNALDQLKIKNAKSEVALEGLVARKKQKLEEDLTKEKLKNQKQVKKEQIKQPKEVAKKSDLDLTQFNKTLFTTTAFLGTFYKMFTSLTAKLEEGASLERLQNQYKRVFGTSGIQADIRKFTTTSVSEMDAMQAALNMGNAGVVHSQEEAADLIAKAATASKMANIDVSTGIREVTEALKNGSIANLEHLNILKTNDPALKQEMSMLQKMTGIMSPAYMAQYRYNLIKRALTRHTKDHMKAEMDLLDIVQKMTFSFKFLSGTVGIFLGKAISPLVLKVEDLVANFTDFLTRVTKDKSLLEFTKNLVVIGSVVTGVVATLGGLRLGMMMLGFAGMGPFGVILTAITGIALAMTDLKPQIADIGKLLKIVGSTFSGVTQLVSSFFLSADNFSKGVGKMDKKTADFLKTIKIGNTDLLGIVENISRTLIATLKFINDVIDKIKSGITSLIQSPMFKSLAQNLFGDSEAWSRSWIDEGSKVRDFMVNAAAIISAAWAVSALLPGVGLLAKLGIVAGVAGGAAIMSKTPSYMVTNPAEGMTPEQVKTQKEQMLGLAKAKVAAIGQSPNFNWDQLTQASGLEALKATSQKVTTEDLLQTQQSTIIPNLEKQIKITEEKREEFENSLMGFFAKFAPIDPGKAADEQIKILKDQLEKEKATENHIKNLLDTEKELLSNFTEFWKQPVKTSTMEFGEEIAPGVQKLPSGSYGLTYTPEYPTVSVPNQYVTTAEATAELARTQQFLDEATNKRLANAIVKADKESKQKEGIGFITPDEWKEIFKEGMNQSNPGKNSKPPKMDSKNKPGCNN